MSTPLSGKAVLVTGASAGIGRATTIALAQAGAKIIATGRRKLELDTLAKQCGGGCHRNHHWRPEQCALCRRSSQQSP